MSKKAETWRTISSEQIADCRVFQVREDTSETGDQSAKGTFYVLENPDWVNIIALTESREVVLIEQYRHGIQKTILEIPGGMVDAGEEPLTAARRELLEETGYSSDNFILLGKTHPNPAIQNNTIYHYLALDCVKTAKPEFDEHESIITKLYSVTEIENLIKDEKITHSLVLACFYKFNLYRKLQPNE
jgi:8-oxo-dGTP pyrophosphatase MutT (NUDIX family)